MLPILNQGGGLRYHFRALRYRRGLWKPFRQAIAQWLPQVLGTPGKASGPTILVGPSGGHCLDTAWLASLPGPVLAIDWDPLAPLFFRLNHPRIRARWIRANLLARSGQVLESVLKDHPDASVLFCNFLGQAEFCSPAEYPAFAKRLPELLRRHRWASFHDLYSGEIPASATGVLTSTAGRPTSSEIVHHFFKESGELNEHELPELPAHPWRNYWCWPLTDRAFHIIEGIWSGDDQATANIGRALEPDPSPRDPGPRA